MAANTAFVTENVLRTAPLPNHGGKYSVIEHGTIIDETRKELKIAGFNITRELYKTNKEGQIAQGIYHLDYANDKDLGLMFAWSNSYNKMMRFKCAVGAQVFICMNGMVSGDLANYSRKHVGTGALNDAISSIQYQIGQAQAQYNMLISNKEAFKSIILTKKDQSALLGRLFADVDIITPTQSSIVKREMNTPTHNYNANKDSVWAFYNHVTLALKESHPINYLSDHQIVHSFFVDEFCKTASPAKGKIDTPVDDITNVSMKDIGVIFS